MRALIVIAGLACSGCSWLGNSATGTIVTGSPADDADTLNSDKYASEFSAEKVDACKKEIDESKAKKCRNDIINYRLRYYDGNYYTFRRLVLAGNVTYNSATDIAVLGLNAAGTLVGGATTKSILHAISGGLVGTRGIIDKDVYFNSSINTLIAQMDADRTVQFKAIAESLATKSTTEYPLSAAEIDALKYYNVGTLPSAIQSIIKNAGAKQAAAETK